MCEGGWSGSIPQGLPDLDAQPHSIPLAVRSIEDTQHISSPAQEDLRAKTFEFRRGLFSMDARKNVSTTALRIPGEGGDRVQEDSRLKSGAAIGIGRRSYETAGLRNRSMTNLGITAGRQ